MAADITEKQQDRFEEGTLGQVEVKTQMNSSYKDLQRFYLSLPQKSLRLLLAVIACVGHARAAPGSDPTSLLATVKPAHESGAWELVPLPKEEDRMQSVHVALLPDGLVLVANGSSFRLAKKGERVYEGIDGKEYDAVNNTGLFNPVTKEWCRIESPPTPVNGMANDLFCAGHLHTPNGDVLFAGGNRENRPKLQFAGSKFANLFDWRFKRWGKPMPLAEGHWYPTLVPFADGHIAVVSGLPYDHVNHKNTSIIEFFDSRDSNWSSVNLQGVKNGPFSDGDRMHHYPRMFPVPGKGIFITGDGSGGGADLRRTYFMNVAFDQRPPKITFAPGPDHGPRRVYGTGLVDPNSKDGDILLIGGALGTEASTIGPFRSPVNQNLAVSADLERYDVTANAWRTTQHFLGERPTDQRIMHTAVILPTKDFLVVGGGNYTFHSPVFEPSLCTFDKNIDEYKAVRMNPGTQPRLYHSNAILLPDATVLVAGGNAARAALDVDDGSIHLYTHRDPFENTFSLVDKGTYALPAEVYQMEIFHPPYLFTPDISDVKKSILADRPIIHACPEVLTYKTNNNTAFVKHANKNASLVLVKLGSATHGCDSGQRLVDLECSAVSKDGKIVFDSPIDPHSCTPGYYMLFCVSEGVPSKAKFLRVTHP